MWRHNVAPYRLRVSGLEHLPKHGPFLICPNHLAYLDPFYLAAVLPMRTLRQLFFVGASEYFETPVKRRFARAFNLIPVDPDANLVLFLYIDFTIKGRDIRGFIALLLDLPSIIALKEIVRDFVDGIEKQ